MEAAEAVVDRRALSYADVARGGPPTAVVDSGEWAAVMPEEVVVQADAPMEGESGPSPVNAVGEEGTFFLPEGSVPEHLLAEGEAEGSGEESEAEGMEVEQPSLKRKMEGAEDPTSSQDVGSFPGSPDHRKQWSTRTCHKHYLGDGVLQVRS